MTDEIFKDRAITPRQKADVLDCIYGAWTRNPDLRLGQLLMVACKQKDLFYVEDFELAKLLENKELDGK